MEFITVFTGFIDGLPVWVNALTGVVVALKAVTIITPTTHDNEILDKVLKVLNFFALNILKDKNADA